MKWFFALNEAGNDFENYAEMLKVAVLTARKFTALEPHFLYDGAENSLTEWLRARAVKIIKCRSFLYDKLQKIADKRNDPNYLGIGAGAFLRTEIPRLSVEIGIADKYVLYTDVDVMFLTEVAGALQKFAPRFFAVAPEHDRKNYLRMNSGVMVMNLENLRVVDEPFRRFMSENIDLLVDKAWDQGAYQIYFKGKLWGFQWDKLPPELNWKPYWGENPAAKIVHFHGPKPHQAASLNSPNPPEHLKPLLPLVKESYKRYCEMWSDYSAQANNSSGV